MHPVFLTLANINGDVRMKATAHAWACVAFLPIPQFNVNSDYQTILQSRVYHTCIDRVFSGLKRAAKFGEMMADPSGILRWSFTPLVAWVADLVEQQLIAGVAKSASPISLATTHEFGDGTTHPPRHGSHTLQLLYDISKQSGIDPWELGKFQTECKKFGLLGVHLPFWRDWTFVDPAVFLVPEILHTCHKFFFDHIFKWCKEIVGKLELDARYKSLHPRVGIRHFGSGVSHVKQMTGREHREIQRTIVPVCQGAAPPGFIRALRAMVDFLYQAQAPRHTDSSIPQMMASLQDFHNEKGEVLNAGGRNGKNGTIEHFNIPKLEILQHFPQSIRNLGATIQYTADVTERLLITHCKDTFTRTNHRVGYESQIVEILDRLERLGTFTLYALLKSSGQSLVNVISNEATQLADTHPQTHWISRVLPDKEEEFDRPRPMRNFFAEGSPLSEDAMRAYHLTKLPDVRSRTIAEVSAMYGLDSFIPSLLDYAHSAGCSDIRPELDTLRVWNKFKIQLYSAYQIPAIMPAQTVQALPPDEKTGYGLCDNVLLEYNSPSNYLPYGAISRYKAKFATSLTTFLRPSSKSDPIPNRPSTHRVPTQPTNQEGITSCVATDIHLCPDISSLWSTARQIWEHPQRTRH